MKCKICQSENTRIEYDGVIRDGGLGKYTRNKVKMYRCCACGVIWHEPVHDNETYYESSEYRIQLEGTTEEQDFYRLHDSENYNKFTYTGTTIFRNKNIADIGCGCGSFLDFLAGVVKNVIAIEPSEIYRKVMKDKGFHTFAYAKDAKSSWNEKIDVVTSFDVIEHVDDPNAFVRDVYELLAPRGIGIIGTPTDAPFMREMIGDPFERTQLFSTQHLWVLSEDNLKIMAKKAGFKSFNVRYFQRYGIKNFLGWMKEKKPNSTIVSSSISSTIDMAWKSHLENRKMSDYIVLYVTK